MRKKISRNGRLSLRRKNNIKPVKRIKYKKLPEIMNFEIFRTEIEMMRRQNMRNSITHRLHNIVSGISIIHMMSNIAILWEMFFYGKFKYLIPI